MADDKNNKGDNPTPPSEENNDEKKDPTVELDSDSQEDTDFEKELEALEADPDEPIVEKPRRTELEKAEFTAKSTLKRIKELGGDPRKLLGEEEKPAEKPPVDQSQFVTKLELAQAEAEKLAKTPGEAKVIMWWVKNKGMSVSDAHFLVNKNKIQKTLGEVNRSKSVVPASPNGGAGGRGADAVDVPELSEGDKQRLIQSGMIYDPKQKAYIGAKIQHRYDEASKQWVTEKVPQK